jgi:hypothetical protein
MFSGCIPNTSDLSRVVLSLRMGTSICLSPRVTLRISVYICFFRASSGQNLFRSSMSAGPHANPSLRRTKSESSLLFSSNAYDTEKPASLLDDSERALFKSIKVDVSSITAVDAIRESHEAPTVGNIGVEKALSPRHKSKRAL